MKTKIKNALISVSDKENLTALLRVFKKFDVQIISSGGTYKEIKKLDLDYVVDLHSVLRTNFLRAFIKVPFYQIDKGRDEKENLVSGKIFTQLKSTHQRYRDVFKKIGISIDPSIKNKIDRLDISDLKSIPKNNKLSIYPTSLPPSLLPPSPQPCSSSVFSCLGLFVGRPIIRRWLFRCPLRRRSFFDGGC